MAIEKYTTEALVIAVYDSSENDSVVKMYTREFGMITGLSKGLRKSIKMRPHVQPFRESYITLVKGRDIYRIVGVVESQNNNILTKSNKDENLNNENIIKQVRPYIASVLARFVQGEQKNAKLYDRLMDYLKIKNANVNTIRLSIIADVLMILGYMDIESIGLSKNEYINISAEDFYIHCELKKKDVVHSVQSAIKDSML